MGFEVGPVRSIELLEGQLPERFLLRWLALDRGFIGGRCNGRLRLAFAIWDQTLTLNGSLRLDMSKTFMNGYAGRVGDPMTFCVNPSMDWVSAVAE
jgi:hypothetical protein